MQKSLTTLLCLASSIFIAQPAVAQFGEPVDAFGAGANDDTSASALISSAQSIAPGETFKVALKLTHPPKWHSYYFNDGIGISQVPAVKWTLPKGFKTSSLTFPTPHSMDSFGLNSYGYDGTNYFFTEITAPDHLAIGETFDITADASWQICKISCIQEDGKHTIKITCGENSLANPAYALEIADYQKIYIPTQSTPEDWKISAKLTDKDIEIQVSSESKLPDDLKFYEYNGQLDAQKPITITSEDGKTIISGKVNEGNDFAPDPAPRLNQISGILHSPSTVLSGDSQSVFISSTWEGGIKATPDDTPQNPNNKPSEESNEEIAKEIAKEYDLDSKISIITLDRIDDDGNAIDDAGNIIDKEDLFTDAEGNITDKEGTIIGEIEKTTFLFAALLIFGGGLILNLMPCVFPVLGVKVLGFVQLSGNDPKKIKMHGLVFTLGVIVSMWILAAVILTIRYNTGSGVAWGSQMKNPIFVGTMIILMAMFALNLYGVFEVGTKLTSAGGKLHAKKGYEGSFFSGILTTLIATPCGAPLLATAMTYTLQQTVFLAMILFTIFALGVAAPYLVLSFFPALINKLPKPGNWMVTFKKSMAFPLLATVVFLLSAFIGQTGQDGIILMLWSLVVLATAAFIYGTWSPPFIAKSKRYTIGFGLSLLLTVYGGHLGYQAMTSEPEAKQAVAANPDDIHSWASWKPGLVDQTRAKKRIVWIDYTADW
jgi:DsbC/DsbD-like thiol-disulfide interchange protein/cytochrome c biogenesis protein CcdA